MCCDTLVALGNSTKDGSIIFGKNSDRPNDEVQLITHIPAKKYSNDEMLKCTYIEIPQAPKTNSILLSQPYWLWGAEMGSNEHGVVIGNEAVHTYEPLRRTGLLGMDLLRLGLERGNTARDSLNVIADLLVKYHQGGGCAFGDSSWTYHNSFLIADESEAYVLETADDWWIAEAVKDVRSISNGITIRGKGDLRRNGIIQYAIEKGYCKDDEDFDFSITFSGSAPSKSPYSRHGKSTLMLEQNIGQITPSLMMDFLREHDAGICMHGGFESTGSQVSHLRKEGHSIHWFTGTTLPCQSVYKPYAFPVENMIYDESGPHDKINPDWSWVIKSHNKNRTGGPKSRNPEIKAIKSTQELLTRETKISDEEFIQELSNINQRLWNKP